MLSSKQEERTLKPTLRKRPTKNSWKNIRLVGKLTYLGYGRAEIAKALGLSKNSVNSILYYYYPHRKKIPPQEAAGFWSRRVRNIPKELLKDAP